MRRMKEMRSVYKAQELWIVTLLITGEREQGNTVVSNQKLFVKAQSRNETNL